MAMTEGYSAGSAEAAKLVPQATQDALVSTALSVLREEFWTMAWIALFGLAFGMITVGIYRRGTADYYDNVPKSVWMAHRRRLYWWGVVSAFIWTYAVELGYMYFLDIYLSVALVAAVFPAALAGGLNEPLYLPVKIVWSVFNARLRKKAIELGADPNDMAKTEYNGPDRRKEPRE